MEHPTAGQRGFYHPDNKAARKKIKVAAAKARAAEVVRLKMIKRRAKRGRRLQAV